MSMLARSARSAVGTRLPCNAVLQRSMATVSPVVYTEAANGNDNTSSNNNHENSAPTPDAKPATGKSPAISSLLTTLRALKPTNASTAVGQTDAIEKAAAAAAAVKHTADLSGLTTRAMDPAMVSSMAKWTPAPKQAPKQKQPAPMKQKKKQQAQQQMGEEEEDPTALFSELEVTLPKRMPRTTRRTKLAEAVTDDFDAELAVAESSETPKPRYETQVYEPPTVIPVSEKDFDPALIARMFRKPTLRELMAQARSESEPAEQEATAARVEQQIREERGGDYASYLPDAIPQLPSLAAIALSRNASYSIDQRAMLAQAVHQLTSR